MPRPNSRGVLSDAERQGSLTPEAPSAFALYNQLRPEGSQPVAYQPPAQDAGGFVRTQHPMGMSSSPLGDRLIQSESGGNWQARNSVRGHGGHIGHFGRGQFGVSRLQDAQRAGVIPQGMTPQEFMRDPVAQQAVEAWHVRDIGQYVMRNGLNSYVGTTIKGIPVTPQGMLNVAHLGGNNGLRRFLTSGGQYDPADANGTRLSDYLRMGAGQSRTTI